MRTDNPLQLALETSSPRGSVAIGRNGQIVCARTLRAERRHTGELLPAIRDSLTQLGAAPHDVREVHFSHGPGSFTGLRVAATVARMWQSATGCRVIAVPSLEVIARNGLAHPDRPGRLAVILNARQGKLFGAVFVRAGDDQVQALTHAGLFDAAAWLADVEKPCWVLGDAVGAQADAIAAAGVRPLPEEYWWPDARHVLAVGDRLAAAGEFCRPEQIVPAYLRPPECELVYEKRRAAARARRGD